MQVTFFIGNGFDRAMGLRTSYYNFYEFCMGEITWREREENRFIEDFMTALSKDQPNEFSNWADLENKLGNFMLNPITEDDVSLYGNFHKFIGDKLCEYLKTEEERVNLQRMDRGKFPKNLKALFEDNNIKIDPTEKITLNFIVFNYTDALRRIIKYSIFSKDIVIGEVLNVHGSIRNGSVVFGIGKATEDSVKGWDELETNSRAKIEKWILKERMLSDNKGLENYQKKAIELLKKSEYIITFGASIGKTDYIWWKHVKDILKAESNNSQFMVSEYVGQRTNQAGQREDANADKIKKILMVMQTNKDEEKQIESKIQMLWNPDIFSGLNVFRDGQNNGIRYREFQQSQKVLLLMPVKNEDVSSAENEAERWLESICDDKRIISKISMPDPKLPKELTVGLVREHGGTKRIHYSCFDYNDERKFKTIGRLLGSRDAKINAMYIDSVIMLMDFTSTSSRLTSDEQKVLMRNIEWYVIRKLGEDWSRRFLLVLFVKENSTVNEIETLKESVNLLINEYVDQTYMKNNIEVVCKNNLQAELNRIVRKSIREGKEQQRRIYSA